MAIIYPAAFKEEAERLAQHRSEYSNLKIAMVNVEQLYNEFSSGRKDAGAIRDFARMMLDRSPEDFKSLLLFGDGSFDSRDLYKLGGDFIPVYETAHSTSPIYAFPTDDFYALLSDNEGGNINFGSLDIGVGRLPVKDVEEARAVVNKIIHYDTNPTSLRDWRNRITFVADDEDNNLHIGDTDDIAQYLSNKNPNLNVDKIYLDAFPQVSTPGGTRIPLANDALNNNIFKGTLTVTFLGHGGPKGWTQERILQIEDILSWQNMDRMPLIITATCSFTVYDNPAFTSAGELALLNEKGGAIGLFTTVRPVFASANERLTRQSMDTLFNKLNNERPTLGEVLRIGKNKTGDQSNSRKYLLIGDPSQQLALPNYNVTTTKVNGHDISNGIIDTIQALQKVTIEGEIHDDFGNIVSNFNGVVYPTIFDKNVQYRTLSQDAGSPSFDFDLQKNVIFKGRASVSAGKFQYTFVVPKDIDYTFGDGKISYYAADEALHDDAAGNYQEVVVGGTDPNALADSRGPKVEVFMNDENFVFGGITDKNPALLVKLEDDNGINVVGNSIGHDLAGVMDKNSQVTYKLNDYYEAALDDYTKGEVRYPLYSLAEGRHEIKVTAWDIANNAAEGFTEFLVVTSEEMALRHVLNYPNPFTTSTCFMFEHNQSIGVELDVLVQIYTISGRLIKTLEERIISEGSRLGNDNCIRWNGRDDYGDPLGKGVYLYKVKVRSANTGDTVLKGESEFEKLVILK
jgi:peptidase C25-like protein